jgi:hypothetical protein
MRAAPFFRSGKRRSSLGGFLGANFPGANTGFSSTNVTLKNDDARPIVDAENWNELHVGRYGFDLAPRLSPNQNPSMHPDVYCPEPK